MEQLESSKTEEPINGNNRPLEAIGQSKKTRSKPGLEGSLEQLSLFQSEIYRIELTDEDLKDLMPVEVKRTKWEKFVDKVKDIYSNLTINLKDKRTVMRIIILVMIPAVISHTLAIGQKFRDDRSVGIVFIAYSAGIVFAMLFELVEHLAGRFENRPIAHIASGIIGLFSYTLSMVGWKGLYEMEADVLIFGIGLPIGINHILANIFSILPPLCVYAFTAHLYTLEQEEKKRKEDKKKADQADGKEKTPYTRVQRYTKAQTENFVYEIMMNPNVTFSEFSLQFPEVAQRKFDQLKAAARKKLREHQTNKQKKK